jgi:hypothetical protein
MDSLGINWGYLLVQSACMLAAASAPVGAFVLIVRLRQRR